MNLAPEVRKQKRAELRAEGICMTCGKRVCSYGYTNCDLCRQRMKRWKSRRFESKFDALVDRNLLPTDQVAKILGISKRSVTERAQLKILEVQGTLGKAYFFSAFSVAREKRAMKKRLLIIYHCLKCEHVWHPKIHALPERPRCSHCGSRRVVRV